MILSAIAISDAMLAWDWFCQGCKSGGTLPSTTRPSPAPAPLGVDQAV
jgi:hypothetical protein